MMPAMNVTEPKRPASQWSICVAVLGFAIMTATAAFGQSPGNGTKKQTIKISAEVVKEYEKMLQAGAKAGNKVALPTAKEATVGAAKPEGNATKTNATEKPDSDTQKILDTIKTLPRDELLAMIEYYKDLGVDLNKWMKPDTESGQSGPRRQLVRAMRTVKFVRRPEDVLKARSEIGMEPQPLPPLDASDQDIVNWFHRHVMAAEWAAVKALLVMRAGSEAEGMYAAMIQGTNHSESELIPEDVLGLSEAAPGELTSWQVDSLAGLLKSAAKKTSTGPLIARLREGTTSFLSLIHI